MIFASIALLFATQGIASPSMPVRVPVATFSVAPAKFVTRVEAMRSEFLPNQAQPEHMHPVPVICFVAKGSFIVSIGDQPVRTVHAGEATVEEAGTIVHYFRNVSATEPAALNCMFLVGPDDKQLTVLLNK